MRMASLRAFVDETATTTGLRNVRPATVRRKADDSDE